MVKNKVAAPFREAEFDIMFSGGISREGDLLDLAIAEDIVRKSGAWFSYNDVRLGQGRENVKVFLADNPDLFEEIRTKVIERRLGEDGASIAPSKSKDAKKGADAKGAAPSGKNNAPPLALAKNGARSKSGAKRKAS